MNRIYKINTPKLSEHLEQSNKGIQAESFKVELSFETIIRNMTDRLDKKIIKQMAGFIAEGVTEHIPCDTVEAELVEKLIWKFLKTGGTGRC